MRLKLIVLFWISRAILFDLLCHRKSTSIFIDWLHMRSMTSSLATAKTSHFCSNQRLGWGWPRKKVPCGNKKKSHVAQEKKTPESRKKRKTPESRNKIGHLSSRAWGLKESRNGGSELADHVSIELFRKIDIWHKNVVFQFETCKIYSISTCS